jgi:hypothetical protein
MASYLVQSYPVAHDIVAKLPKPSNTILVISLVRMKLAQQAFDFNGGPVRSSLRHGLQYYLGWHDRSAMLYVVVMLVRISSRKSRSCTVWRIFGIHGTVLNGNQGLN